MQETNAFTTAGANLRALVDIPGAPGWVDMIALILGLIFATIIINLIITLIGNIISNFKPHKKTVISLIVVVFHVLMWLIFITVCMTVIGVDFVPLLACLGVGGISIGIALKDSIASLMAGITLIVGEVFVIGDVINVAGVEGEVEEITIRYTKLLAGGERIYVPNLSIVNSIVVLKKSVRLPQTQA